MLKEGTQRYRFGVKLQDCCRVILSMKIACILALPLFLFFCLPKSNKGAIMHNLTKIKLFRILLYITYLPSLIFIYPFAALKRRNQSHLFFFFDRYVIGGAQRIHIDILNAINTQHKQLYFTRKSVNTSLKKEFYTIPNTEANDIHFWCDNLLFRLFTVHFYTFYINRHERAHVFGSNSTFFYDMLPFLKKTVIKTELLHNFTHGKNGMEFFGLANHKYLNNRIVYDNYTLSNIESQYKNCGVPDVYKQRVLFIEPGVHIPPVMKKTYSLPIKILYAGRGGPQKRIYLLDNIARHCIQAKMPVEFHFAGTMTDELSAEVKDHSVLHGEISGQNEMYRLYEAVHVILMTSAYEGFPMLIKEGMACGCVPLVTALVGNKGHLHHLKNALLIEQPEDEDGVVKKGIEQIEVLIKDINLLERLSGEAYRYAGDHFAKTRFDNAYKQLLR